MAISISGSNITFPNGDTQTGMVSNLTQTSGTPTGGSIESGSNTNGTYIKFPDGTMICNIHVLENRSATGVRATAVTFPQAFADIVVPGGYNTLPVSVLVTLLTTRPDIAIGISVWDITTTGCIVYVNRTTTTNTPLMLVCYGRWY